MKKLLIFFFILKTLLVYSDEFISMTDYTIMRELFFPVEEGGENEVKLISYIERFCKEFDITYNKVKIDNDDLVTNSWNIELILPGIKSDIFNEVIIVPLDSIIDKGRLYDVSINQFIALELAKFIKEKPLYRNVYIVFTGANSFINEESWGVKQYLENNSGKFDSSLVTVLNLSGDKGGINISGSIKNRSLSRDMLDVILKNKSKYSFIQFDFFEIVTARLGFFHPHNIINELSEVSKTSIIMSNHKNQVSNGVFYYNVDAQNEIIRFFKEWVTDLSFYDVAKDSDYNYQLLRFGSKYLFISEVHQVIFYMLLIVLLILSRRIVFYFRPSVRYLTLKAFPYYIFLFVIYYILSLSIYFIGALYNLITNHTIDYANLSLFYFFIIFFMPLFIVLALFDKIQNFPVPKHNVIYMHGAVFFAHINFIIFLILNVSLAYIYITVILMLFFSHLTGKNIFLKYLIYILASVPFVLAVFTVGNGHDEVIQAFFQKPYMLHLFFCYFSFSFFLLLIRVSIINKIKLGLNISRFVMIIWISFFLFSFFLFYSIALYRTYGIEKIAVITQYFDREKNIAQLEIDPKQNIGPVSFVLNGENVSFTTKKYIKTISEVQKPFVISQSLKDGVFKLKIESSKNIRNANLILKCPKGVSFSRITHKYSIETNEVDNEYDFYKIWIARNIGKIIQVEIELVVGSYYEMLVDIEYNELIGDFNIQSKFDYIDYKSVFSEKIEIIAD
ncbi:MAG: hypothetical protein A2015_11615 [Spirochaetes bacterium GWF1_31_7]|nr:MAG: hypothetical protein A2015_11615 [Spirochaetes bacterium GWF1_31_7]